MRRSRRGHATGALPGRCYDDCQIGALLPRPQRRGDRRRHFGFAPVKGEAVCATRSSSSAACASATTSRSAPTTVPIAGAGRHRARRRRQAPQPDPDRPQRAISGAIRPLLAASFTLPAKARASACTTPARPTSGGHLTTLTRVHVSSLHLDHVIDQRAGLRNDPFGIGVSQRRAAHLRRVASVPRSRPHLWRRCTAIKRPAP